MKAPSRPSHLLLVLLASNLASSVRAGSGSPKCPIGGAGGQCDFVPSNPFKCNPPYYQCEYDTDCHAKDAGYNVRTQCCQSPPRSACPAIFQPVLCGDLQCPYDSPCLASLAGYDVPSQCTYSQGCQYPASVYEEGDVVWSDEFNAGSRLDENIWSYDEGTGDWGWGNGELQEYTSDSDNVRVQDGMLKIIAREDYRKITSGRVNTKDGMEFQYGTLEARIKVPDSVSGLWPAFWTLGRTFPEVGWPASGEIDIMEIGYRGYDNRRIFSAAHWEHEGEYAVYDKQYEHPTDLNDSFHVYKLEWTPSFLITYIDGIERWRMDITPEKCSDCTEFHQPHFILLNLAVGGGFTTPGDCGGSSASSGGASSGSSGGCSIRTIDDITAPMPAEMLVDWVRVKDNGYTRISTSSPPVGCPAPSIPSPPTQPSPSPPSQSPPSSCRASPTPYNAGELVWSDEFDQGELNNHVWSYDEGDWGWGNGELQDYTRDPFNVRVQNGLLQIVARQDGNNPNKITSGRIKTKDGLEFQYGTLEARIRVPDTVSGLWPAFWMLGHTFPEVAWPASGEIDIMNIGWRGENNRRVFSAAHWEHDDMYALYDRSYVSPTNLNGGFHNYKLEWTSTMMTTYVDGNEIWKMDITPESCHDCTEFHQSHFILLNLAVGGGFTTDNRCGNSGGCRFRTVDDITAPLPGQMDVDWIRLYSNGETILTEGCPITVEEPNPAPYPAPSPSGPTDGGERPPPTPTSPTNDGDRPTGPAPSGPAPSPSTPTGGERPTGAGCSIVGCPNGGACALHYGVRGDPVCCASGESVSFLDEEYCTERPNGSGCARNVMCESNNCEDGTCRRPLQPSGPSDPVPAPSPSTPTSPDPYPSGPTGVRDTCVRNIDCGDGRCGYVYGSGSDKVCCDSGDTVRFEGRNFCTGLADGSDCSIDAMCSSNYCRDDGVCRPQPTSGVGETCRSDSGCRSGACGYIFGNDGGLVCCRSGEMVPYRNRMYCTDRPNGSGCGSNAMCASDLCLNGICSEDSGERPPAPTPPSPRPPGGVGDTCQSDYGCRNGACGYNFGSSGDMVCCQSGDTVAYRNRMYCTDRPNGSGCGSNAMCASDLCLNGICSRRPPAPTPPSPRPPGGVGDTCRSDSGCRNGACGYIFGSSGDMVCCQSGDTVVYRNRMYCTDRPNGSGCGSNAMCASDLCLNGICSSRPPAPTPPSPRPPGGVGDTCQSNSGCRNGACGYIFGSSGDMVCCQSGDTVPYRNRLYCTDRPNGSDCGSNAMCASDLCLKGICSDGSGERPPAPSPGGVAGAACRSDSGCRSGSCGLIFGSGRGTVCCRSGDTVSYQNRLYCTDRPNGSDCGNNAMCASDRCRNGICISESSGDRPPSPSPGGGGSKGSKGVGEYDYDYDYDYDYGYGSKGSKGGSKGSSKGGSKGSSKGSKGSSKGSSNGYKSLSSVSSNELISTSSAMTSQHVSYTLCIVIGLLPLLLV